MMFILKRVKKFDWLNSIPLTRTNRTRQRLYFEQTTYYGKKEIENRRERKREYDRVKG